MANNTTTNDSAQAADNFNRARRSSVTQQTFTNLFGRSNSTAGGPTPSFPGPITTAAAQDQRRRMSIGTLGLSGSPTQAGSFFGNRRGSVSTAGSDSIDENAIEDDDAPGRGNPTTPFARRMSFGAQALRTVRGSGGGGSPNTSGRTPIYTTAQEPSLASIPSGPRSSRVGSISQGGGVISPNTAGNQASMYSRPRTISDYSSVRPAEGSFNWGEQVRSRAESSVSQSQRPSFSTSPGFNKANSFHDRTKSVSEMPAPPIAVSAPAPRPAPKKPDAFQERILKGDFYMD